MKRRRFLGTAAAAAAALTPFGRAALAFASRKKFSAKADFRGRSIRVRSKKVFKDDGALDEKTCRILIREALAELSGSKDTTSVFRTLFDPEDWVGIKVNTIAGRRLSTRPELVRAVISFLDEVGVKRERIVVFDRYSHELRRAGFHVGNDEGYYCVGTDGLEGGGYSGNLFESGRVGTRISRIVTERCTALIDMPVVKDHELAGVSGSLKNWYGVISNPNKYHANGCDPFIADLNELDLLRRKVRLAIADGTLSQCEGGPGYKRRWAWRWGGIVAGTDLVAVDEGIRRVLEEERARKGLPTLEEAKRPARFIGTCARRGLGVVPEKVDLKEV
ncbi:MAG: DUF362 domain-containing protein [Candidatus Hydrogenedentota bacterium]|nr:MAG: DUF362 domain-containing protein [Candidatus Hydrogenedentota bacterium]